METKKMKAPSKSNSKVLFEFFAPLSLTVQVAGTFNNWDPKKGNLKKDSQGNWSGSFEIKPGRHEYRFVVDGNWENDQDNNEIVPNNLGTFNNVIVIR